MSMASLGETVRDAVPLQDLLRILSTETYDLIAMAQSLDDEIPNLVEQLQVGASFDPGLLQLADTLAQHLQDIQHALGSISLQVSGSVSVETKPIIDGLRLDYFRAQVSQPHQQEPKVESGLPHLF